MKATVKIENEKGGGETVTFKSPLVKITIDYEDFTFILAMKKEPGDIIYQIQGIKK